MYLFYLFYVNNAKKTIISKNKRILVNNVLKNPKIDKKIDQRWWKNKPAQFDNLVLMTSFTSWSMIGIKAWCCVATQIQTYLIQTNQLVWSGVKKQLNFFKGDDVGEM